MATVRAGGLRILVAGWGVVMLLAGCQSKIFEPGPPPPPAPPVAAPAPAPVPPPVFYVNASRLNLRAGPGMDFPKLMSLERNEPLEKLTETDDRDWAQVRVQRDGTLGWVATRYLSSKPVPAPTEIPPSAPPVVSRPSKAEPPTVTRPPLPERPAPPEAPSAPLTPKKKVEEVKPLRPEKPPEVVKPAPTTPKPALAEPARPKPVREPPPGREKTAPEKEKPALEKEKPIPPAPEPQKQIRIM